MQIMWGLFKPAYSKYVRFIVFGVVVCVEFSTSAVDIDRIQIYVLYLNWSELS